MKHLTLALTIAALFIMSCGGTETADTSNTTDSNTTENASSEQSESSSAANDESTGPLNPNLMGAEVLAGLEGISTELADKLIAARPILSMTDLDDLLKTNGLDEAARKALYPKLFVPINLNTAPGSEMFMVPGVGKKMAHEFEEYRPYSNPEQFRREIGKYVDENEVARFEQYVFVPVPLNNASDEHILSIPGVGGRMLHEFKEYRPYSTMEQFKREIGKYVDDKELSRLVRYVVLDA